MEFNPYVFLFQWVEAMQRFTEAAELINAESRMKTTMWGQFWSAHQRFFKYLCIAAKVGALYYPYNNIYYC